MTSDPKSAFLRQREVSRDQEELDFQANSSVDWGENNTPISSEFDDVYYSKSDGLAESQYVFLEQNHLPKRFAAAESFTIGELGFGVGLNFLATLDLWLRESPESARLHYISFEKRPLSAEQMRAALSSWPQLGNLREELLAAMPMLLPGMVRLEFPNHRVSLTLALGDARILLGQLRAKVDAWYLDGFSPAKNPDLWSAEIFTGIAANSSLGGTFSTYTSASAVRRGLVQVGFEVEKVTGFGHKREMLRGSYQPSVSSTETVSLSSDYSSRTPREDRCQDAIVIGAGMAGCAVAERLAARGFEVSLFDSAPDVAQGASGNPAAIMMPHLTVKPDLMSRFYLAGYRYLLRQLDYLDQGGCEVEKSLCGVLRFVTSKALRRLWSELEETRYPRELLQALSAKASSELSGIESVEDSLFFPRAGWVDPRSYCAALLASKPERISKRFSCRVAALSKDSKGVWSLLDSKGEALAFSKNVVIANAYQSKQFAQTSWIPLEQIRGQVLNFRSNEETKKINTVLCYDGFVIPERDGEHFVGATYNHDDSSTEVNPEHREDLLRRMSKWFPQFQEESLTIGPERVAFRAMSPDRVPLIGPVADPATFTEAYLEANDGRLGKEIPASGLHEGLYMSLGHGSRGLLSCGIAAEVIASRIARDPAPIEHDLLRASHPSRFLLRSVKRGLPLV